MSTRVYPGRCERVPRVSPGHAEAFRHVRGVCSEFCTRRPQCIPGRYKAVRNAVPQAVPRA
eukprot:8061609-Lingulodinium_polyedra.AAC.1